MSKSSSNGQGATRGGEVLVVPDVHLKIDRLNSILDSWGDRGSAIFLGDFFDDFGDTPELNRKMAELLKERVLHDPRCIVLMGNHDLNYHPKCQDSLRCSGFTRDKLKAVGEVLSLEDFGRFKWAHAENGFLFTHAGLHPRLAPPFIEMDGGKIAQWVDETCRRALDVMDESEPLLRAGYSRWGFQPVGGVIWMDVREYEPLRGVAQIFGHTPLRTPEKLEDGEIVSYCVDTHLEHVGLLGADGGVTFGDVVTFTQQMERVKNAEAPELIRSKTGGGVCPKGDRGGFSN